MSELEFIAALVAALAWPSAAVAAALVLRPAITRVLQRDDLRRLKAGPVEAEWGVEAQRTQVELQAEGVPLPLPLTGPIRVELGEVAARAPAAAVLEAFLVLERELRGLLVHAGVEPKERPGAVGLARQAAERGLISDVSVRAVEGLAVLRNLAAHGHEAVGPVEAADFLALADATLYGLQHRPAGGD